MHNLPRTVRHLATLVVALIVLPGVSRASTPGDAIAGRWDAAIVANDVEVPFSLEISAAPGGLQGTLFNGDRRITSTATDVGDAEVVFRFAQFATALHVAVAHGGLAGSYERAGRPAYPFKATRASAAPAADTSDVPRIAGEWISEARSRKGERAWRFIATQEGARVEATILRVDGDTGTLAGRYTDGRFILSHFSGVRPLRLEVTPLADGTLRLVQNGTVELIAARAGTERARAIGEPTDPSVHTQVADPGEPFRFSFPDLSGAIVSNADVRFRNRVVLVNISGSWCPNCHDEAPFLAALYRTYRDRGLEIVTLSFEEADQLANPARLRAFIAKYGIDYTVLLAGVPDQVAEKVPQAINLNAVPTTFVIGRDGLVKLVHAGFPSPGSGEFYAKAERELTGIVERLLGEGANTDR